MVAPPPLPPQPTQPRSVAEGEPGADPARGGPGPGALASGRSCFPAGSSVTPVPSAGGGGPDRSKEGRAPRCGALFSDGPAAVKVEAACALVVPEQWWGRVSEAPGLAFVTGPRCSSLTPRPVSSHSPFPKGALQPQGQWYGSRSHGVWEAEAPRVRPGLGPQNQLLVGLGFEPRNLRPEPRV